MQLRWRARSRASACTAMLATLAGGMTAVGPAAAMASTCQSWVAAQPPSPGSSSNHLNGVTVVSPCDAWAVGSYTSSGSSREQNLVEHWNGASWKVVPSPSRGRAAVSSSVFGAYRRPTSGRWVPTSTPRGTST